jgi:hypothetical protein
MKMYKIHRKNNINEPQNVVGEPTDTPGETLVWRGRNLGLQTKKNNPIQK